MLINLTTDLEKDQIFLLHFFTDGAWAFGSQNYLDQEMSLVKSKVLDLGRIDRASLKILILQLFYTLAYKSRKFVQ